MSGDLGVCAILSAEDTGRESALAGALVMTRIWIWNGYAMRTLVQGRVCNFNQIFNFNSTNAELSLTSIQTGHRPTHPGKVLDPIASMQRPWMEDNL